MTKFKIYYDDDQMNVIDKISAALKPFSLRIENQEGGDGWEEFEIIKMICKMTVISPDVWQLKAA